jgi:DNA-binding response OmpR family regulator
MRVFVSPSDPSSDLADALVLAGADLVDADDEGASPVCAVVDLSADLAAGVRAARHLVATGTPIVVVVSAEGLPLLETEEWWDDLVVSPINALELRVRIRRLAARLENDDLLAYEDLILDTATYQATLGTEPVDLTYMEYELLRFFVEHRGRVWSREQLLSRVWGYEYFGGARTVDVHVRRLRAKLGEERGDWITTVRSVGYRFG